MHVQDESLIGIFWTFFVPLSIWKHKANKKINRFFFDSGHSRNENDSVHSVIERSAKQVEVFVLEQWCTLISRSASKKSYIVIELEQLQIFDFADVSRQTESKRGIAKLSKMQIISYQHWAGNYCYSAGNPSMHLDASFKRIKQINHKRQTKKILSLSKITKEGIYYTCTKN